MDIVKLEGTALKHLLAELQHVEKGDGVHTLRVSEDVWGVKFKVNERVWSPSFVTEETP